MALMINDDCISCDACLPVCPNNAISEGESKFRIDPDLCTECVAFSPSPQCIEVCPATCIVPDPHRVETKAQLTKKNNKVHINW